MTTAKRVQPVPSCGKYPNTIRGPDNVSATINTSNQRFTAALPRLFFFFHSGLLTLPALLF